MSAGAYRTPRFRIWAGQGRRSRREPGEKVSVTIASTSPALVDMNSASTCAPTRKVFRSLTRPDLGATRRVCFRPYVCVFRCEASPLRAGKRRGGPRRRAKCRDCFAFGKTDQNEDRRRGRSPACSRDGLAGRKQNRPAVRTHVRMRDRPVACTHL